MSSHSVFVKVDLVKIKCGVWCSDRGVAAQKACMWSVALKDVVVTHELFHLKSILNLKHEINTRTTGLVVFYICALFPQTCECFHRPLSGNKHQKLLKNIVGVA